MREGRISQTALKVSMLVAALGEFPEWAERLPANMVAWSERLTVGSGVFGYGPRMMRFIKGPRGRAKLLESARQKPGTFFGLGHRKLYMDAQVCAAIEAGATQVAIVGAGFDTLCLRRGPEYPEVRFFELDHGATSDAKRKGIEDIGRPPNLTQIRADLASLPLSEVLAREPGWDVSARSVFVAEGLLMYLELAAIEGLFRAIAASSGPGTRVAFSHLQHLDHGWTTRMSLRLIGEPWLSCFSIEERAALFEKLDWKLIDANTPRSDQDLELFATVEHDGPSE